MHPYLISLLLIITFNFINCYDIRGDETIEEEDGTTHSISWETDLVQRKIIFNLEFNSKGFVGLGISPNGGMKGSDIMIGGVDSETGIPYLNSYFAHGNQKPDLKTVQNWHLLKASQNETHTLLQIWRFIDACDENDVQIPTGTSKLIWAVGDSNTIQYHSNRRGTFSANLVDHGFPEPDISNDFTFRMTQNIIMPPEDTTHWCSIHKWPQPPRKYHIIGYKPFYANKEAKQYTHHIVLYKCPYNPNGQFTNEFLESLTQTNGSKCTQGEESEAFIGHCRIIITGLMVATGSKHFFFPPHVGVPIGDSGEEEFYMLEVHYNNVEQVLGKQFETGMDVIYSENLREFNAGLFTIGQPPKRSLVIPPNSQDFIGVGLCAPECLEEIPPEGIRAFAIYFHAHWAARKMKFRHIRGDVELPWLGINDAYDTEYQQATPLENEVLILPGDQFIVECSFNTSGKPGEVTFGGAESFSEMCQSHIWHYERIKLQYCFNHYPIESIYEDFQMNINASDDGENKIFMEKVKSTEWTPEFVQELQDKQRFGLHSYICETPGTVGHYMKKGFVASPEIVEEYQPPAEEKVCD